MKNFPPHLFKIDQHLPKLQSK